AQSNPKKQHPQKSSIQSQLPTLLMVAILAIVGAVVFLPSVFAQRNPIVEVITPETYTTAFLDADRDHFLLDVRRPDEFVGGHIAGAANISVETLANNLSRVPKDVPIVLYCRSGNRSAQAADILAEAGYTEVYDLGGIIEWQRLSLPVVR
ncbi:MAG: rhodanese-like domain-containing protein, partial [Anaerolineae bacterium]|nr:rhodanese-like domain-containing protein [Anaerolineae bacterium]